jgi:hypothetical protein
VADPVPNRVQVVPRAAEAAQKQVQVAPNRPRHLSLPVAEAAPKSSKIVQVALSKKTDEPYRFPVIDNQALKILHHMSSDNNG